MTESERSLQEAGERVKNGILWLGSTTLIWQIVNWVLTVLTARYLLPTDYGTVALAETVLPYLWIVASLSANTWVVQRRTLSEEEIGAVWGFNLLLGSGVTVVAVLLAPLVAQFYDNPQLIEPFRVLSLVFFLHSTWSLAEALLERELNFKQLAVMNLVISIVRGLIQLGLAMEGYGFWSLVAGMLFREVGSFVWLMAIRRLPRRLGWNRGIIREICQFGFPASGSSLFWIISHTADNVIVGKLFGTQALGYYSMAFYLTDLPLSKLNTVVRPILTPYFSRLKELPDQLRQTFLKTVKGVCLLTFPVLAGMCVVAPHGVPLVFGGNWSEMTTVLQVMCLVGLVRASIDNISPLFMALGQPGRMLIYNTATVIVMPPAFYYLGRGLGMEGIYLSWLVVFPLVSLILLMLLQRAIGLSPLRYLYNIALPSGVTALMVCATILFTEALAGRVPELVLLILQVTFGAAVYSLVLRVFFWGQVQEVIRFNKDASRGTSSGASHL